MDGGSGTDTVDFGAADGKVVVRLADGTGAGTARQYQEISGQTTDLGTDTLRSIENVAGTSFNDDIRGNSSANTLDGRIGNDLLDGRGGNDVLRGGAGIDTLIGGAGSDSLTGGAGVDTFKYAAASESAAAAST